MKRILFILFLCCIGSGLAACQDEDHTVPTLPSENDPEINDPVVEFYDWEKNRTELLTSTDMVLLYGGGHHRTPYTCCLLYTSPSPRDMRRSRMPSSA